VATKKKELQRKKLKPATLRNKITTYIKELNSRQEEVPLLEKYIDKAKSEPLHLKNNTTKELFMKILKAVLSVAEIPSSVKMFSELSSLNLLSYFIGFVAKDMNCNYLAKKLRQWFNESSDFKNEKNFSFRFRGKESYHFLQHFPMLIASLIQKIDSTDFHFHLFQVFYQSLMLRKLVSFSVRINDISMSDIDEMEKVGRSLFKCCCLYDL